MSELLSNHEVTILKAARAILSETRTRAHRLTLDSAATTANIVNAGVMMGTCSMAADTIASALITLSVYGDVKITDEPEPEPEPDEPQSLRA